MSSELITTLWSHGSEGMSRQSEPVASTMFFACTSPVTLPSGPLSAILFALGEDAEALEHRHLVLAQQALDAGRELVDHLVLARHDDGQVELRLPGHDAERLRVRELVEQVGRVQQRLGRDAAAMEAGSAQERILLDDGGLEAELPGADRGDIAAGAGAQNCDVEDFVLSQDPTPRCVGERRRRSPGHVLCVSAPVMRAPAERSRR